MAKKRRKNKKRFKISSKNIPDLETGAEQRKKFPKELVKAFIDLEKTSVKIKENGISFNGWTPKAYKLYEAEAKKYLDDKFIDRLECGRLVVLLTKATMDMFDVKKKKEKEEK